MFKFLKSYLGIHELKKFFIIILKTVFYSCFYTIKANQKDIKSADLFYIRFINEVRSNTSPNQNK